MHPSRWSQGDRDSGEVVRDEGSLAVSVKDLVRKMIPRTSLDARAARSLARTRREFAPRTLQESFEVIYERRLWGDGDRAPLSGSGSGDSFAESYASLVREVIRREGAKSVADLGCGDFSVGRRVAIPGIDYVGVDIVPGIITKNSREYESEHVRFELGDLTGEVALPVADLGLLRQVLQHLSNDEIGRALKRCAQFETVLVTEHIPSGNGWPPNVDKPHGPDIRLYDGSGVLLEAPPFSLQIEELNRLPLERGGGVLRTVAVRGEALRERLT